MSLVESIVVAAALTFPPVVVISLLWMCRHDLRTARDVEPDEWEELDRVDTAARQRRSSFRLMGGTASAHLDTSYRPIHHRTPD